MSEVMKPCPTRQSNTRNLGVDFVRILAAFGVVVLHFIGQGSSVFNTALYLSSVFAIPVFVMSNGFFVLNRQYVDWAYSLRKALDYLALVAIWCLIDGTVFAYARRGLDASILVNPIESFILSALQLGDASMLWFLWMLAALQILTPALRQIRDDLGWHKLIGVLGIVCLLVNVCSVVTGGLYSISIQRYVPQTFRLWTWIFYYCLGGFIGDYHFSHSTPRRIQHARYTAMGGLLSTLLWGGCIRYGCLGLDKAEYLYDDLSVMLLAIGLFLYSIYIFDGNRASASVVNLILAIANAGLGIYVLQIPLRMLINHFYSFTNPIVNIVLTPLAWLVLLAISLFLNKTRFARWLVKVGLVTKLVSN